jgi:phage gp45-like
MSSRSIRTGVVHEESNDKGPFKLVKVMADGKVMDLQVLDITGSEGSPLKDSQVLILTADGDDGRAYGIIAGPPTKDRTDKQKPGEVMYKNHKRGQSMALTDDGSVKIDAKKNHEITAANDVVIKSQGKVFIN